MSKHNVHATPMASETVTIATPEGPVHSPEPPSAIRWEVMRRTPFNDAIVKDENGDASYISEEVALAHLDQLPDADLTGKVPFVFFIRCVLTQNADGKPTQWTDKVRYVILTNEETGEDYARQDSTERAALVDLRRIQKDRSNLAFKASDALAAAALRMKQ